MDHRACRLLVAASPLLLLSIACGTSGGAPPVPEPVAADPPQAPPIEPVVQPAPVVAAEAPAAQPAPPAREACPAFSSRWGPVAGERVRREDLGEQWPLTVEEGCLYCDQGSSVVFVHGGREYQVNGAAASTYRGRVRDLEEIWAENPEFQGLRVRFSIALR